ncbi:hypothetical protein [Cellulosilyticum ruminicola]|uniref:hypothetical protein n=1 Tax=Cellulosilyticum ruminicola TaxID=425254 RepID=UPI0012EE869F|nr:hypothetical protein [Cellulosilyticum ruminicola]
MDNAAFEKYQYFTEQTIANLSTRITTLEEKLNVFTNLLAVSQYVNQYIKTEDFYPLIADTLIGVFGAKYATIYLKKMGIISLPHLLHSLFHLLRLRKISLCVIKKNPLLSIMKHLFMRLLKRHLLSFHA